MEKAFPVIKPDNTLVHMGMDLRDWFAGMALHGLMGKQDTRGKKPKQITDVCYKIADAMMESRENGQNSI